MPGASSTSSGATAPIQAVRRAMQALELLADTQGGMTVLELAEALDVDKSISSRLLGSLASDEYVVRAPGTDRYELSFKLLATASRHADRLGFPGVCQPALQSLSDQTSELVQLAAIEGVDLVLVAHARSQQSLAVVPHPLGTSVSLHASASGKAWLATLTEEEAIEKALGNGLRPLTPYTITSVQGLLAELAAVRARGYAIADSEHKEGIGAVACAIGHGRFGTTVATVAVSAPTSRLAGERIDEIVPALTEAARELETVWPLEAVHLTETSAS